MSEKFEQKAEKAHTDNNMADFSGQGIDNNKHYEAAKMTTSTYSRALGEVEMKDKTAENAERQSRKEFPHGWEWLKDTPKNYGLPSEAAFSTMTPVLQKAWREINQK